jgi:DNA polymerase-3 subunit epsilon
MKRLFLDTETTGTDAEIHAIHQIAGCIEIDNEIVEKFDFKIRPFEGAIINPEALAVSGVTFEQIMEYPLEAEGYFEFKNMLTRYINPFDKNDKFIIIGANIKFDIEMLFLLFFRNNNPYLFSLIYSAPVDILSLFADKFEDALFLLDNFKLITIAKFLEIELDESKLHNAEYDIEITREVYYRIKNMDYSYNHIEISELKKFWDCVYPKLNNEISSKCLISICSKTSDLVNYPIDKNSFKQILIDWDFDRDCFQCQNNYQPDLLTDQKLVEAKEEERLFEEQRQNQYIMEQQELWKNSQEYAEQNCDEQPEDYPEDLFETENNEINRSIEFEEHDFNDFNDLPF